MVDATLSDFSNSSDDLLLDAYRHDAHKMNGEPHDSAPETFAGVPVNQTVPHGADRDASVMSRPSGKPGRTVDNHETHYRLSLVTGSSWYDPNEFSRRNISETVRDLLLTDNAEEMHRKWLDSDVVARFNESVYYPYTSLKYHTLLVAALLDNYRDDTDFEDLELVVDPAGEVIPHRTIFTCSRFTLRIAPDSRGRPSARLGSRPWRSWASTWTRLQAHPLDTDHDKYDMVLDSNLRRIWAWSSALQYMEDYEEWRSE